MTEMKTLNGFPLVDTKAREQIVKLSEEMADISEDLEMIKDAVGMEDSSAATVTGDRLLISDCAGGAFGGLSIYGATYQSESPSVENPQALQPIGLNGAIHLNVSNKNLINRPYVLSDTSATRGGVTYVVNADGSVTASGTNTSGSDWGADFRLTTFKDSFMMIGADSAGGVQNNEIPIISKSAGLVIRNCYFQGFIGRDAVAYLNVKNGESIDKTFYPQIEFGDAATDYEAPVAVQRITIATPNGLCGVPVKTNPTYIDGSGTGWICDEIDLSKGKHIQRIGIIASYAGEEITTDYISSTGTLSNGATVHYVLPEAVETALSDDVVSAYNGLTMHSPNTSVYVTYNTTGCSAILSGQVSAATMRVTYTKKETSSGDDGEYKFDLVAYGLPMLYLTGDTALMTKDNAVTLNYVYGDKSGTCTCKWQGSSSISWEKKNYTIKFDNEFEAVEGWGAQKKYCFKANFIDHSHARNVVNAKLWGQIVKSRDVVPTELADLPNAGAVDGFPCVIMLNGEFYGLYTWNIPKDGWMFGMSDDTLQQAILCADTQNDACGFKALATLDGDFDLEYVADEDNADWVVTSLNALINACMNSDGTDLDTTVAQYLDWDSAIDYYIFTAMVGGNDMVRKNYLLATYDGVKWFFSAYDMDTTYGLNWRGDGFNSSKGYPSIRDYNHRVMELINAHKKDELKARYTQLRNTVLSEDNLYLMFSNWASGIPRTILEEDARKWPTIPSTAISNTAQILNWYRMRCAMMDKIVDSWQ